jgi:hypothetical protein
MTSSSSSSKEEELSAGATKVPTRNTFVPDGKKLLRNHHTQADQQCKIGRVLRVPSIHPIFRCSKLRSMTAFEKCDIIRRMNLCFNCLQEGHSTANCPSTGRCRTCHEKHSSIAAGYSAHQSEDGTQRGSDLPCTFRRRIRIQFHYNYLRPATQPP